MPALEISNLHMRFGGVHALRGLNIQVPENSVLGVIGVNGSGKSTMLNCICGMYPPSEGSILVSEKSVTNMRPDEIASAGVGRTFQVPKVFNRMTLVDNMIVPALSSSMSDTELRHEAIRSLERVNLAKLQNNYAEELSGGQQKLLELSRLMMVRPKLVLLDEPFAGVNPTLCLEMIAHIEAMVEEGATIVLVSHDLTSIYKLSNHIIALNEGQIIAEGGPDDIKSNQQVIDAYLGA
jgi:branched-chain amino acid transport system ATP-binding protein